MNNEELAELNNILGKVLYIGVFIAAVSKNFMKPEESAKRALASFNTEFGIGTDKQK